jgi:hypothetical protein
LDCLQTTKPALIKIAIYLTASSALAKLPAIAANWAIKSIPAKLVQRSVVLSITVVFAPEPTAQPAF